MADIDYRLKCWYKNGCHLAQERCERTCVRYLEMNYLINNCGMKDANRYLKPLQATRKEVVAYQRLQQIKDNIVGFTEAGQNLFICAPNTQTGKTSWSLKILYKYFDEIWSGNGFRTRGYFLYVPEFLSKMKSFDYKDTDEYKEIDYALKNADLVIWDDITSQILNSTEQNILNLYIDKRFMEEKANIFNGWVPRIKIEDENKENKKEKTEEEKLKEVKKQLNISLNSFVGQKLCNRLMTNCEIITLTGPSRIK